MADTEIEITADLVRDLLREQHPDLAWLAIREVSGGWGNQMWRLGDELAVRMQRMDLSPELQLNERRWLPVLAARLPLPVPTPVRFGEPSACFPKHWTVMTWVPGEPLDNTSIGRVDHAADTLAAFLRALHTQAPAGAPVRQDSGDQPKKCTDSFDRFFHAVVPDDSPTTSGPSGTTPSRRPSGRVRRSGCMATCIRQTSSSRPGRSRA